MTVDFKRNVPAAAVIAAACEKLLIAERQNEIGVFIKGHRYDAYLVSRFMFKLVYLLIPHETLNFGGFKVFIERLEEGCEFPSSGFVVRVPIEIGYFCIVEDCLDFQKHIVYGNEIAFKLLNKQANGLVSGI